MLLGFVYNYLFHMKKNTLKEIMIIKQFKQLYPYWL